MVQEGTEQLCGFCYGVLAACTLSQMGSQRRCLTPADIELAWETTPGVQLFLECISDDLLTVPMDRGQDVCWG